MNARNPRLFLLLLLITVLALPTATVFMQTAGGAKAAGKLVELKISTPALKGNLLGDPMEQPAAVYLPPGYESTPARRYPSLYLLHGYLGRPQNWTVNGYQGLNLAATLDDMINSGRIQPMIIVVPNGGNAYNGSFYTNSVVTGNWEDYITRDLINYIDTNYRTLATAASRGIAGHSMGGYGAIALAMKHPDLFGAVYALSPCCLGLEEDLGAGNPIWQKVLSLSSPEPVRRRPASIDDFRLMVLVALSAAFSPNTDKAPLYADYPYKLVNGQLEINEPAMARWQANMPLYQMNRYQQNFQKLRGIYIDYGQNEQFTHIRTASKKFSSALAELGVPHTFEVYAGGNHSNKIRERLETRVLQFFSHNLQAQ